MDKSASFLYTKGIPHLEINSKGKEHMCAGYIAYLRQAAFPSLTFLSRLDILVLGVGEIGHEIAIDISTEGLYYIPEASYLSQSSSS